MDIFIIDILASHKLGSIRDRKSATATCNFENNPKVAAAQGPPTQKHFVPKIHTILLRRNVYPEMWKLYEKQIIWPLGPPSGTKNQLLCQKLPYPGTKSPSEINMSW